MLQSLSEDPHPEVSGMAEQLLHYLIVKAKDRERLAARLHNSSSIPENGGGSSSGRTTPRGAGAVGGATRGSNSSVPSSPAAKPSFMLGTSPTDRPAFNRALPSMSDSTVSLPPQPSTSGAATTQRPVSANTRRGGGSGTGGTGSRSHNPSPNSTAQSARDLRYSEQVTDFLPWSSRHFTRQLMRSEECDADPESPLHWMKEWLYGRNLEVRFERKSFLQFLNQSFFRSVLWLTGSERC